MSRNLVTVKTRSGFIRVPGPKIELPNAAEVHHERLLNSEPAEAPTGMIVGEHGPETVVILRNPREAEPEAEPE